IWFESYAPTAKFAVGDQIPVTTEFIVRRPGIAVMVGDHQLPFNEVYERPSVFNAATITQPYWLRHPHALGRFAVAGQADIGRPGNSDAPRIAVALRINGKELAFERPIVYKY